MNCPVKANEPCRTVLWTDGDRGFPERVVLRCVYCERRQIYILPGRAKIHLVYDADRNMVPVTRR